MGLLRDEPLPDVLYKLVAPDGIVRTIQSLACGDGHEIAQPEVGIGSVHAILSNAIDMLRNVLEGSDVQLVDVLGSGPVIEALEVLGQNICLHKHFLIRIVEAGYLLSTTYSKRGEGKLIVAIR